MAIEHNGLIGQSLQANARIRSCYVNIALACGNAVRWAIKESLLRYIETAPPGGRDVSVCRKGCNGLHQVYMLLLHQELLPYPDIIDGDFHDVHARLKE